jgi:hypothetical protein
MAIPEWAKVPHAFKGGLMGHGAGGGLVQYGMFRDANRNMIPGVVYASNLSDGTPKCLPLHVQEGLRKNGITSVVNGHQPFGDGKSNLITCVIFFFFTFDFVEDFSFQLLYIYVHMLYVYTFLCFIDEEYT